MLLKKKIDVFSHNAGFNPRLWHADRFGRLGVYGFGSAGFVSSESRMNGRTPLPARSLSSEEARRLAGAMNSVDGLATADLSKNFIQRLTSWSLIALARLPDSLGGANADILSDALRQGRDRDLPQIHAFDAGDHVDSKADPFTWGLCTDPAAPLESSLSEQTYTREDAERLAAAWNATMDIPLPALEMRVLQDIMNLYVFLSKIDSEDITRTVLEIEHDNEFRDVLARNAVESIEEMAGLIEASRRASGVCVIDGGETANALEDSEDDAPTP